MSEVVATQAAYRETLVALGKKYPDVVVFDADFSVSTKVVSLQKYFQTDSSIW